MPSVWFSQFHFLFTGCPNWLADSSVQSGGMNVGGTSEWKTLQEIPAVLFSLQIYFLCLVAWHMTFDLHRQGLPISKWIRSCYGPEDSTGRHCAVKASGSYETDDICTILKLTHTHTHMVSSVPSLPDTATSVYYPILPIIFFFVFYWICREL